MKKISKKQKLIVGIAILLIAIILAIIITINTLQNPSNDKIMQEGYLGTTSNAGSSLIARYIKEGVKHNITVKFEWQEDETTNQEDSQIGQIPDNKISIPVTVTVRQYLGEPVEEYNE